MASLKYEELRTCLNGGGSSVETLKLCVEAFSKKDKAFLKAVRDMSFWCPHLFSLAFSDNASTRILAVKCLDLFMSKFVDRAKPISDDWWKSLKLDITKKYAVVLAEKLDTFEDWDTLWKLCVSILDIELYQSTTLVNALLKVAEKAFRDKSLVIPAFSCWKHFITVYAKSPNVMFSSKQISLLITPLTAKTHYTLKYCEIKLEVWNTLILLVLDKSKQAVDVIITPLLNFLYGPLKMPVASSFPELVDRSAESYLLVLNNSNVFKYIDAKISSYLPKVVLSIMKSKKLNEELVLRLWKTFLVKVKQIQTLSLLDNAVETISLCKDNLNGENTQTFMKLIDAFMVEHPDLVFKNLHLWILSDKFLSLKFAEDTHSLELIFRGYEDNMSQLESMIGHLFYVPLNFKRDDATKWDTCLSNLSELWCVICDVIHLTIERNDNKHNCGLLSTDALLQLLLFPVECLYDKWCSRIMKQWRLICNDSISILPATANTTEFGKQLIDKLIVAVEKHPKSLQSVVFVALEICGILLSSILLKGSVKQAVPLMTCIMKLIEQIESVQSRHSILLNEALPKISLWSNLHVELNTDLMSLVETILAMCVIGTDNISLKLKNKIAKVSRQIRSNIVQIGTKPSTKEVPSTPKSAIKSTSFMHRLDKALRQKQNSHEDLKKLLTPEKPKKNQEEDEYVYIAPKTKVTPLTKHQKEMMKSRRVLPSMINGQSQDTQSQDSQALDVILSVSGSKPVKRTLDSTKENAIDELLDEFETKDDLIFDRVANCTVIKQEPEISNLSEEKNNESPLRSKGIQETTKNELDITEKPMDSLEGIMQESQVMSKDSPSACVVSEDSDAVKEEICSKILSLMNDENKKCGNNLGKFFNILINEPHPALYLFHKLKELTGKSGEIKEELLLIYKEFSTDNLKNLYNTLNMTISSESESPVAKGTEDVSESKAAKKSTKKNDKSLNAISDSTTCGNGMTNESCENSLQSNDATQPKLKSDSQTFDKDVPKMITESANSNKTEESILDSSSNPNNDFIISPAFRARRKINPPKRFSPIKKDVSKTPTKISPKLLRSRKSLGLPTTQSSPIRTKPRRSLNMKVVTSSDRNDNSSISASAKKILCVLTEESEKKSTKDANGAEGIEKDCELKGKKENFQSSESMDVDEAENVCPDQGSGESRGFSEQVTASLEGNHVRMSEPQFGTLADNEQNFDESGTVNNPEKNKLLDSEIESTPETSQPICIDENTPVEIENLNHSAVDLDESRDFTLTLAKTPKSNGDSSPMESSPEIFDSVSLNDTTDVFKTASENKIEGTGEESDEKISQKRILKTSSGFKNKSVKLLKSALINGMSPLKQNNGISSSFKDKNFGNLDSWVTRSSKQSENCPKLVEYSQNSDIIESSQPDVSLSSFKVNKSVSISSPIMTQFNSSIYCSPKSVVETEPGSGSKPKVARKLILNERETSGMESNEKSRSSVVNNENSYEPSKKIESDDSCKVSNNFNHKLNDNTKVLSPRNQYLGRTALMMNMAIGDDNKVLQTPSSKPVQKEISVTPSPPRTPQHLNSVGKKWVKRRYISDAPPTPSILKKSRNDENEPRSKAKLVSFSDPPMIEVLEFSTSDPQKDTVYGLDIAGLSENTPDDISTQGSIPEMPEVSNTKMCYSCLSMCRDPISGIVPLLVEPKWQSALKEKFENRNVMTVGCLASLTELQACQLPVGEPRLFRIKNALKEYNRSLQEKRKEAETQKKYEISKFMCKFLMPAGIDKAIKDKEEPPKDDEKMVASNLEGPEENDVITSSINIDSGIDDSICDIKTVEPKLSEDIIETSQTSVPNEANDSSVVSQPEKDVLCSLKENLSQVSRREDSISEVNTFGKELGKFDIKETDETVEKDTPVSSLESHQNYDNVCIQGMNEFEKENLLNNQEEQMETTEVMKDSNVINEFSSCLTDERNCSTSSSVTLDETALNKLRSNDLKITESQSDELGLTRAPVQSWKHQPNKISIDEEKVSCDNVEEPRQDKSSDDSETVKENNDREFQSVKRTISDSAMAKSDFPQTLQKGLSCSSKNNETNEKDDSKQNNTTLVENAKFVSDNSFDNTFRCPQPDEKISGVVSSIHESPAKGNSENSESIVQASPVPKSAKRNIRSLRKRKAATDAETPRNKVLRSSGIKKSNQELSEETERAAVIHNSELNKQETSDSSEIVEKQYDLKKSIFLPLEKDSPSCITPNNIEVPVERYEEAVSVSETSALESFQITRKSGNSAMDSGTKNFGNLHAASSETKKELMKIFFCDEDASAAVALLKDTVLDRVDVKRELFNYLLNDEELGVKFCVKF